MNIKGIFKANRRFRIIPVFFLLFVLTSGIRLFPEETIPPVVQDGSSKKGDYEIISGNLKLVLYKETGTFTLYKLANTGKNKYEPILDTRNYGAGTKYSVRFGKKFYSLEKKFFRTIGFEVHDGGKAAAFVFTPSDNFQVRQKFYFSGSGNGEDSFLIIENSVENTSGNEEFFSFRALFDTVLGETGSISRPEHFITDTGRKITSETLILPGDDDRLLFSTNGERSCAFLLSGMDVDVPESLYIANWHRCEAALTDRAEPSSLCAEGRAFSTVYTPNDSAVLFSWPGKKLAHREKLSVKVAVSAMDYGYSSEFLFGNDSGMIDGENVDLSESDDFYSGLSFEEKRNLYSRISERLNQIEAGDTSVTPSEIAELNRILDIILEEE